MARLRNDSRQALLRHWIWCLLLTLLAASGPALLARAAPPATQSLQQAVEVATRAEAPVADDATLVVDEISRVATWAFGTSATIPADEESSPLLVLFLAEHDGQAWQVAIEHTSAFRDALKRAPKGLLTDAQRATLEPEPQLEGNGSMQLSLPWATGETQYFTGGPHGTALSALDFSGGSGIVRAAREGVAYLQCGASSDYVRVDHGGGLSTNYYHLTAISVGNGQSIGRGAALGRQSTSARCLGGSATGNHLHFWITQGGRHVAINGIDIGGWTVSNGAAPYQGCLTRVRDGLRRCTPPYQAILNEGMIGSGIQPARMDINAPGDGASISGVSTIRGWAIHEAAASGTGVDTIHVYFDGPAGSGARGAAATYGLRRDDVAAAFGDRYRFSGYELPINTAELSLGQHSIYVYARSTVTGEWQLMTRRFVVVNTPPNIPTQALPAPGTTVSGPIVEFSWQDPLDPDNRPRPYRDYAIEVRNSSGELIVQTPWMATTSWATALADGIYTWRIQSGDGEFGSGWSNAWQFTVSSAVAKPSNLLGAVNDDGITLTWQDNATNETGFRVYRWRGEDLSWPLIGEVAETTFTDQQVRCGVTYFYIVSAYNGYGESEREGWAEIAMPACPPPEAPSNPRITETYEAAVEVTWNEADGFVDGYRIYRATAQSDTVEYAPVGSVTADERSFLDGALQCERSYSYQVSAFNQHGESERVTLPMVTTASCPIVAPQAPTASDSTRDSVALTWSDENIWEHGFRIYRWDAERSTWSRVGQVEADVTRYVDQGLACETTYLYDIRTYRSSRETASVGQISAQTKPCASDTSHRLSLPLLRR